MAKASEKYEVMYIINPNLTEEETCGSKWYARGNGGNGQAQAGL